MRTLVQGCLMFCGCLAALGALMCAFVTFATNDYRPILAAGAIFGVIALGFFTVLISRRRRDAVFYVCVGVLPSLLALGELARRTAIVVFRGPLERSNSKL